MRVQAFILFFICVIGFGAFAAPMLGSQDPELDPGNQLTRMAQGSYRECMPGYSRDRYGICRGRFSNGSQDSEPDPDSHLTRIAQASYRECMPGYSRDRYGICRRRFSSH